jgi:hypothetical protein
MSERLSQFTPDPGNLDRDQLIFEAGRRSVPPPRGWQTLAGLLCVAQVLTLVFYWPRALPPTEPAQGPPSLPTVIEPSSPPSTRPDLWLLSNQLREGTLPPPSDEPLAPDPPPLRVLTSASSPLLD